MARSFSWRPISRRQSPSTPNAILFRSSPCGKCARLLLRDSSHSQLGNKASSKVKAHGKAHWPLKPAAQGNPQAQRHHLESQMHRQHQMFDPSIKTEDSLLGQAPSERRAFLFASLRRKDTPPPIALHPTRSHAAPAADCGYLPSGKADDILIPLNPIQGCPSESEGLIG